MAEAVIDAGAMLDERDRRRNAGVEGAEELEGEVDGARGVAALKGGRRSWPVGARTFFVATGLVVAAIVTALLVKARHVRAENETRRREPAAAERVERRVPELKLAAPAPASLRPIGAQPGGRGEPGDPASAAISSAADVLQQRRLSRGFGPSEGEVGGALTVPAPGGGGGPQGQAAASPVGGTTGSARPPASGSLEEKLEVTELRAVSAGVLPDRDYLLTQGAMLDCVLETKLVSTVAGMTSCYLTRDIYSANGHVVLLDRGSKVVGRYQGGMQQGQSRIFVVWTRVETPNGVAVELQSPGTGALGEAGLGGWIDTHFWERFGAAILLSIIGDATDAAASRAAGQSQNPAITFTNQAAASKEVVSKSMGPTLNIEPTLYKNQGERVGILVARDLDFRSVYGVERIARASE